MDWRTKYDIFLICFGFVEALLVFAAEYFRLYRKDARHFAFNADILRRQREAVQLELETEVAEIKLNILNLEELVRGLEKKEYTALPESAPGEVILLTGRRYQFRISGDGFHAPFRTYVFMFDENDRRRVLGVLFGPRGGDPARVGEEFFRDIAKEAVAEEYLRRSHTETRLASIPSDAPQVWGIWDFLYFSIVIQTTIGLGDILPNSSRVRKLVILQVVIGYSLLVVALGIVLSSRP